jgi:hypothetical protein
VNQSIQLRLPRLYCQIIPLTNSPQGAEGSPFLAPPLGHEAADLVGAPFDAVVTAQSFC